jgi:hypothetical protein
VSEFRNKTVSLTEEAIKELNEVKKAIGNPGDSATLRFCIKQAYNNLNQRKEAV